MCALRAALVTCVQSWPLGEMREEIIGAIPLNSQPQPADLILVACREQARSERVGAAGVLNYPRRFTSLWIRESAKTKSRTVAKLGDPLRYFLVP